LGVVCGMATASSAWAADAPLSLSDKVRAAVGEPAANKDATVATTASSSVKPSKVEVTDKGGKVPPPSVKTSSAEGIALSDIPPVSQALEDQLAQDRAVEEAAAKALEDQARQEEEHNRKSYKRAAEGLLPLSPDQIRVFMQKLETTQAASVIPSTGVPKGEVKVVSLSLDPGGEPPQINLAAGYVTTIDIIDQTGEPWPIADVGVGGNFEVTPTQAGSHVVRVVPLSRVGTGNLSILLKDLSTPIIFRLSSGGSTFHMRYDARVPQIGPNAKTPLIKYRRTGPAAGDAVISMVLENAPPKEAKRLKVGGVDARTMAWQIGEKVFVRTPLSLLSPAWNASASSSDGMTVYEIGDAPVLLMSDNGAMIRARLIRDEAHDK